MRKQYTAAEREQFFEAIRAGASVREAATRVGVTPSTAYLWSKSRPSQDGPRFALLVPAAKSTPSVTVRVGAASLQVEAGFDAALLRDVVAALREVT
jgi:transposase-like protein